MASYFVQQTSRGWEWSLASEHPTASPHVWRPAASRADAVASAKREVANERQAAREERALGRKLRAAARRGDL